MKRSLLILGAAVALGACGDQAAGPADAVPRGPALAISDGAHSSGNPDFFFLPPLLPNPSGNANFDAGQFNAALKPVVQICERTEPGQFDTDADGTCDVLIKGFAGADVVLSITGEHYQANWKTDEFPLALDRFYRIRVLVGGFELGFADIDPVTKSQMKNYSTGDYIPLVDGRTLPIKFRIEHGAFIAGDGFGATGGGERVITNDGSDNGGTGTTMLANEGDAGAFFPDGWLDGTGQSEVVVTISEKIGPGGGCHPTAAAGGHPGVVDAGHCFEYHTFPEVTVPFGAEVTVGVCSNIDVTDPRREALRVGHTDHSPPPTSFELLPQAQLPFLLDCEGHHASLLDGLDRLGSVGRGLAALGRGVGRLFAVPVAHAVDMGLGGRLSEFSDFSAVYVVNAEFTGAAAASPSGPVTATARLTALHYTDPATTPSTVPNPSPIALAGETLTFTVISGGGTVGGLASATATTDANGDAAISWTVGSSLTAAVTNALEVSAFGVTDTLTYTVPATDPNTPIFFADFDGDVVGATPGTPMAGTWAVFEKGTAGDPDSGRVRVSQVCGTACGSKFVRLSQHDGSGIAPDLIGTVAGGGVHSGRWEVSWTMRVPTSALSFAYTTVTGVSAGSHHVAAVLVDAGGGLRIQRNDGNTINLTQTWTPGATISWNVLVDLDANTAQVFHNGTPVGYWTIPGGAGLTGIGFNMGATTAQSIDYDNVYIGPAAN